MEQRICSLILLSSLWGLVSASAKDLDILCTTFQVALLTRSVAQAVPGVRVDLLLSPNLGCPHDYMMTPQDMLRISSADVLIINGLGMEDFLQKPLQENKVSAKIVDASQGIEGLLKGNPHFLTSPRLAGVAAARIAASLSEIDPVHAELYKTNASRCSQRMEALQVELQTASQTFTHKAIVTQHASLDYLTRDLGIEIAAVVQDHPGQEPSSSEMQSIVQTIKDRQIPVVFMERWTASRACAVIANEAKVPVAILDPVVSGPENASLDFYETMMKANLDALKANMGQK